MKKIILLAIVTLLVGVYNCNAVDITFTIPADKIERVSDAMKGLYQIPVNSNNDPLFTDNQWAKEAVRRFIISTVQRYETMVARNAIVIDADDAIAQ